MRLLWCFSAAAVSATVSLPAYSSDPDAEFFEKRIRPVLVAKCYQCHSAKSKNPKGGLLLDTRAGLRRGGSKGSGVVPGKPEESMILKALRHEGPKMPPKERLSDRIVQDFETWIRNGAVDPRVPKTTPIINDIDWEQARSFWSFQPLRAPAPPKTQNKVWANNDIDRFLLNKLQENGLEPVGDASDWTMIRRLHYDLTGLPPTPDEILNYVTDSSENKLERLADQLVESPHFGERWGRHWLDVVRYGESTGMERNFTYPYAWRYRDYVIRSLNSDKPFDQFVREQVAGDLLDDGSDGIFDRHLATGLLAMGPKSLNENNREKFAMDVVDEQIDVVSRAFLGLTASCARCHNHKFDPIPTTDYYALAGIFRSTETYYGTGGGRGNRNGGRLLSYHESKITPVATKGNNRGNANRIKAGQRKLQQLKRQVARNPDNPSLKAKFRKAQAAFAKMRKADKPQPAAKGELFMGVLDASQIADTEVRIRGEAGDRGPLVPRGFLTVLSPPALEANSSGRRELSDWIADPQNPLTPRVAVNRIWQHLFGKGIVATVNNFGANGERPTHPELLDHLASKFIELGWSTKKLVRYITSSHAYRLASKDNPAGLALDPGNRLLWRMNQRRLDAEAIRDAMLAASNTLDLSLQTGSIVQSIGDGDIGRGIRPDRFQQSNGARSVYLPIVRGVVPESLRVFDFPEPSIIAGQRDVTTVPSQALYMLNSAFVLNQAAKLANELLAADMESDSERITRAYLLTVCRNPNQQEIERAEEFLQETIDGDLEPAQAWAGLCQALLASAEFRYLD